MHLEIPKIEKHSFRDFAKHYLMIVLSILTALGLEQWIESLHHRHAAEYASAQINAELKGALNDIQTSLNIDESKVVPLEALKKAITEDVQHGLSNQDINKHIQAMSDQFVLSINWPTFPTQAWDVAVANQSAAWIDVEKQHRYASAYASMRDLSNWTIHSATLALDAPRMVDLRTRIRLGKDVDPIEFLCVLQQMINSSRETIGQLRHGAEPVRAALGLSAE
jgi:hypothetical protein